MFNNQLPEGINHFRVGETLFFGTDVYHSTSLDGMYRDVITLYAEVIELIKKPLLPDGELGNNLEGHVSEFDLEDYGKTSWRAIVDIGLPSVRYCADQLHLSANHLGDLVKKETGKSAQEHIQVKLIDNAKEKIFDTSKSVNEVAYELGFKYPQHFSRLFKKMRRHYAQ